LNDTPTIAEAEAVCRAGLQLLLSLRAIALPVLGFAIAFSVIAFSAHASSVIAFSSHASALASTGTCVPWVWSQLGRRIPKLIQANSSSIRVRCGWWHLRSVAWLLTFFCCPLHFLILIIF
jgi:hypothetical protein